MNPGSFAGIARRTTIDGQRRATYVLTSSNASFPIPSWAQGGKGIVYVTGCGGGAGGAMTGNGGSAAVSANRHPLIIPASVSTMNLTIGAAGAIETGGGSTIIAFGSTNALRLTGGTVSSAESFPAIWNGSFWQLQVINAGTVSGLSIHAGQTLARGVNAGSTTGASSLFGAGGGSGNPATGYGAGGGQNAAGSPGFLILEFTEAV